MVWAVMAQAGTYCSVRRLLAFEANRASPAITHGLHAESNFPLGCMTLASRWKQLAERPPGSLRNSEVISLFLDCLGSGPRTELLKTACAQLRWTQKRLACCMQPGLLSTYCFTSRQQARNGELATERVLWRRPPPTWHHRCRAAV